MCDEPVSIFIRQGISQVRGEPTSVSSIVDLVLSAAASLVSLLLLFFASQDFSKLLSSTFLSMSFKAKSLFSFSFIFVCVPQVPSFKKGCRCSGFLALKILMRVFLLFNRAYALLNICIDLSCCTYFSALILASSVATKVHFFMFSSVFMNVLITLYFFIISVSILAANLSMLRKDQLSQLIRMTACTTAFQYSSHFSPSLNIFTSRSFLFLSKSSFPYVRYSFISSKQFPRYYSR